LVHLHQAFRSDVDFVQDILLHPDVMLLVVAEECAVRADSLLAVDTDDLDLSLVNGAYVYTISHALRIYITDCATHVDGWGAPRDHGLSIWLGHALIHIVNI